MADRPATTFGFVAPWPQQMQRGVAWQRRRRTALAAGAGRGAAALRRRATAAQVVGLANRREWWLVPAAARDRLRSAHRDHPRRSAATTASA